MTSLPNIRVFAIACGLTMSLLSLPSDTHAQMPASQLVRTSGHISDFGQVIDPATKQRLETVLANLQRKTAVEFVIATINSPGNQNLYDYSVRLATTWNIGSPSSEQRSMLLLIDTDNGKFWTQSSWGAQAYLIDGLVAEMGHRMRPQFQTGDYNGGLITGIQTLTNILGYRRNFTFAELDQQSAEIGPASLGGSVVTTNKPRGSSAPNGKQKIQPANSQTAVASMPKSVDESPSRPQSAPRLQDQTESGSNRHPGIGELHGQIVDALGGLIVGSTITITSESGVEGTATADRNGNYTLPKLVPGNYSARATAPGFAVYENPNVEIAAGRGKPLDIRLEVTMEKQEVTVSAPLGNSLSMRVLRGKDLDALPIGPGGLAATLRALAFPSTGPNGPQILVDGFSGGRLPPKDSIREIRISDNPFSSEFSQLGFGRIEILTKPGSDSLHFATFVSFNDESLNSRNPFAPNRAPYQSRQYGGSVTGPIIRKRSSFFMDFERRQTDDNALINATILDPALNVVPFSRTVIGPQQSLSLSPRVDFQLNPSNTLVARYAYTRTRDQNQGVGGFSLLSRAVTNSSTLQTLQLTETAILSPNSINETRFQYLRRRRGERGEASVPTIMVPESFIGGGAETRLAFNNEDRWELQNYTSWILGKHNVKAGTQVRGVRLVESSPQNFNGTFTFAGGFAPQLDGANNIVRDAAGRAKLVPITSIERYRRTLLFQQQGLAPEATRDLGGGATQFSIAGGNPEASVSQYDLGAFVQDDWSLRPDLTLSSGIRYEVQNNIGNNLSLAPRIAVAWSPGATQNQSKTVVRAGMGIFYDRFSENYVLQARRFDRSGQQRFIVSDSAILNLFPIAPSTEQLSVFAVPRAITRVADGVRAPYTIQFSVSVERELPGGLSLSSAFINTRTLHMLRSRNINAPLPETFTPDVAGSGVRPFGNAGEIFEYESSGRFNQEQLVINAVQRFRNEMSLWATYVLSKATSDTDGADTFPLNTYNLSTEYGNSALDARHSLYVGGWIAAPWRISVNPLIILRTGTPFNMTTGRDTNGDTLYTERPAFAANPSSSSAIVTPFGAFDLSPDPGQELIPRNYGRGPGFFTVNLGLSRAFTFGTESNAAARTESPRKNGHWANGRGRGWFMKRNYTLTFAVQMENIFNHTNSGLPIGNLGSPLFGQSYSSAGAFGFGSNSAGNRRIELQIYLNF